MTTRSRDVRADAIAELQKGKRSMKLNFLVLALRGKKQGFEKVIKMVDDMVVTLDKEQSDDEAQKTWCNQEFDSSEDTEKDTKRRIEGLKTRISENEESIAKLVTELTDLADGIHALDKSVEEQTEQRHEEHKDYVQTAAENNAALQLLDVAKNRLNKFYNPAVYKAPPKRELTEEERLYVASGGVLDPTPAPGGIAGTGVGNPLAFVQTKMRDAPPPPPETVDAYTKRDSSGPIASSTA
jgi:chromosome segregation ATPase